MSPDTESFLASVRGAEDPTREDERRVLAAVRVALASGVVAGAAASSGKLVKFGSSFGLGAVKGTAVVLGLVAAARLVVPEASDRSSSARPPASAPVRASTPALEAAGAPTTPRSAPVPPGVAVLPSAAPAEKPAGRASPVRAAAPPSAPVANSTSTPTESGRVPTARAELALLGEVQAALRAGDGASALRLLAAPSSGDPRFASERRALRILALCAAGRAPEARREARALLREEPASIQREAIARSCAGEPEFER